LHLSIAVLDPFFLPVIPGGETFLLGPACATGELGMNDDRLGNLLPLIRTPPPGPRSQALAERLRGVESRNVTFLSPEFPVFWREARGPNVVDADGNVFLDLTAAFGVALLGHSHAGVGVRAAAQAQRLVHGMGDVHPPAIKVELLERLALISPWPDARSVLASTGSEAVEIALKTALLATGRPGILAFEGGYHGLTLGALAATGRREFRDPFARRLYEAAFAPFPNPLTMGDRASEISLEAVQEILRRGSPQGDPIGAVILEPVQGRAGVLIPPGGFLGELAELARAHGALLVFDEILTGLGRTGTLFAYQHEQVTPDLICLGKGLGGGFPLSACIGAGPVMDAWPPSGGEALHTSTFLGHPVGCAAGLAVLDEVESLGLLSRSAEIGAHLRASLEAVLEAVPVVREVRGRGLLVGIELGGPDEPWPGGGATAARRLLREGVLVLPAGSSGETIQLSPPLVIGERQLDCAVEILGETLTDLARDLGAESS
jgi:4-aminobutyrate aminotransferase/(S)-3-amino-2-methylpropionate transaminase